MMMLIVNTVPGTARPISQVTARQIAEGRRQQIARERARDSFRRQIPDDRQSHNTEVSDPAKRNRVDELEGKTASAQAGTAIGQFRRQPCRPSVLRPQSKIGSERLLRLFGAQSGQRSKTNRPRAPCRKRRRPGMSLSDRSARLSRALQPGLPPIPNCPRSHGS